MSNGSYISVNDGKIIPKPGANDCVNNQLAACTLKALQQPRFFYGQLLTDQDLTALLNWTQDKLRLARYVQGWGVVCGLEVEPIAEPNQVRVKAGYARDCCGRDIIIGADITHDLSEICKPKTNGCTDPSVKSANSENTTVTICGQTIDNKEIVTVDLHLCYKEEDESLQTPLIRNGCYELRKCEPSRIRESYELRSQVVAAETSATKSFSDWKTIYKAWLDKVAPVSNGINDEQAQLCQIMQRFHNAPGIAGCASDRVDDGVRLARIWLKKKVTSNQTSKGEDPCEIVAIDTYPPHRRSLMLDELPAPPGKVNLARFLWQRLDNGYEEVLSQLHGLGFHINGTNALDPKAALQRIRDDADMDTYHDTLCADHAVPALTIVTVDMNLLGNRIIGFESSSSDVIPASSPKQAIDNVPNTVTKSDTEILPPAAKTNTIETTIPIQEMKLSAESASAEASRAPTIPQSDDLTRLDNVADTYAKRLRDAGYDTFAKVSKMTIDVLRNVLESDAKKTPITRLDSTLQAILNQAENLAQQNK